MNIINNKKEFGIIAYHGTHNDFNVFDEDFIGSASGNLGFFGKGFYFTKDKSIAECYGNVKTVKLSVKNPFIIKDVINEEVADILNSITDTVAFYEGLTQKQVYNGLASLIPEYPETAEHMAWVLTTFGYDSVIFGDYQEIVCFASDVIEILN